MPGAADAILSYRTQVEGDTGVALSMHRLADSFDDTDKAARRAGDGASVLGQRLAKAQTDVHLLRQEFAETGDIRLLKEISKSEREVRSLSGWVRHFGDDSDHSRSRTQAFSDSLESAAGGMAKLGQSIPAVGGLLVNPYVAAVGAGIAINAAWTVAAAAGGLAITGFGLAAITAGVMVRSGSVAMTDAMNSFGATAHRTFFDASGFVEREFVPALGRLEGKIRSLEPQFADLFIGPATGIGPLTDGIMGLIDGVLPGLQRASNSSSEVLAQLGAELPNLGETIGQFFSDISEGSQGGANALMLLVHATEMLITSFGAAIKAAEKLWTFNEKLGPLTVVEILAAKIADVGTASSGAAVSTVAMTQAVRDEAAEAEIAKGATRSLAEAIGLLNFAAIDAAQSQLASANATDRVSGSMKDAKGWVNGNSDAIRANRGNVLAAIETYGRQYDSMVKSTGSVQQASAAFYGNIDALRKTVPAGSAARGQMDALISTFVIQKGVADRAATGVGAINTQIALLHDKKVKAQAIGDYATVARLNAELDRLRNRTVYITTVRRTSGVSEAVQYGANPTGGQQRAAGGVGRAGSLYQVGEAGREWFVPNTNGQFFSAADVRDMSRGGGGGTVVYATINTGATEDAVVRALKSFSRGNYGVQLRGGVSSV